MQIWWNMLENCRKFKTHHNFPLKKQLINFFLFRNYRNQDEEFVKRKKALIQSKISRSTGVILRPKTTPTVNNTASSLLKPTKVWLERCKAEEDHTRLQQKVVYVKDIPKL